MRILQEINGDDRLGFVDRLKYLWRNLWRNMAGCTEPLAIRTWRSPPDIRLGTFSPGRCLTEAFISHQLPQLLAPGEVSVLDVGCGSGRTSDLLATAGYTGRYLGVDLDDRFDFERNSGRAFDIRFIQGDAHDMTGQGPFDLILSISALEHVDDDSRLIDRLGKMQSPNGFQIHFLPAPAGLPVYLWHGYRQYGAHAIADRFGSAGTEIYRLGGLASFLLHLFVITLPEIILSISLRKRWPRQYKSMLALSLRLDRWMPFCPVCHVVCCRSPQKTG